MPHSGKLFLIVGHKRISQGKCVGRDEQVVGTDGLASALELRTNGAIRRVGWFLERQNIKRAQHGFELGGQSRGLLLFGAVP